MRFVRGFAPRRVGSGHSAGDVEDLLAQRSITVSYGKRLHSALGYRTPEEFEAAFAAERAATAGSEASAPPPRAPRTTYRFRASLSASECYHARVMRWMAVMGVFLLTQSTVLVAEESVEESWENLKQLRVGHEIRVVHGCAPSTI